MTALNLQFVGEAANTTGLPGNNLPATAIDARVGEARQMAGAVMPLRPARVRKAGVLELAAAERRIAELERELAAVRDIASTDPLTGVLNRRGLDAAFERELARTLRSGAGMALALIDIDNFKHLNDHFGHHAGDQALVHLVDVVRAAMRPFDVLARFGGEEFVLLLPDSTLADAKAALERFQRALAAQPIFSGRVALTFSAGVVMPGGEASFETSIRRADAATYAAKRAGKNCVVVG